MPELHILWAAKIKVSIKGSMNLKDRGCQNEWLKEDNCMAIDKRKGKKKKTSTRIQNCK